MIKAKPMKGGLMFSQMRIARPVTSLEKASDMYCRGLGLKEIAGFNDHDGFSGIMLGIDGLPWHIEFTLCHHGQIKPSQTEEDLLVFYYPDGEEYKQVCARMIDAGFMTVKPYNPYWEANGCTFKDHDGYHVVIHNKVWAQI